MKFGKPFDEVYDLETLQPMPFWMEIYERVYAEMRGMGVPLS